MLCKAILNVSPESNYCKSENFHVNFQEKLDTEIKLSLI